MVMDSTYCTYAIKEIDEALWLTFCTDTKFSWMFWYFSVSGNGILFWENETQLCYNINDARPYTDYSVCVSVDDDNHNTTCCSEITPQEGMTIEFNWVSCSYIYNLPLLLEIHFHLISNLLLYFLLCITISSHLYLERVESQANPSS